MESAKILLLSIGATIAYGILHDQVTARVCIEYFTVGHPPLFATEDPTWLAFGWGVAATWWFGLFLGIPLAILARAGPPPKVAAGALIKPIVRLMAVVGVASLFAGIVGYFTAATSMGPVFEPMLSRLPAEKHAPYLADSFAHAAAYLTGFAGGLLVSVRVWQQRD